MNPESDDPQLRQLFTEQRQADAQRAPAFESVCSQARSEAECRCAARRHFADFVAHYKQMGWLRPAIAFVVVALMATVFLLDRQPEEQLVASVLNWESPTDFLLDNSLARPVEPTSSIAAIVPRLITTKETP